MHELRQLGQLTLARVRLLWREPEAVFWVFIFPVVLALVLGIPVGALAGYTRGVVDAIVMRAIEAVLCFPTLLLLIALFPELVTWLPGKIYGN